MATMTEITRVKDVEIGAEPVASTPRRWRTRFIAAIVVAAVAVGLVVASAGPSAEELEQAHWQAVVEYHTDLYRAAARAAAADATHWQQVVEHYETQWVQR